MEFMFAELVGLITQARDYPDEKLLADRNGRCITVLREFLRRDVRDWRSIEPAQLAIDFIAGMTDSFFIYSFQELFLPMGTV